MNYELRKYILGVVAVFVSGTVFAQTLNKQLEVSRAYNPEVERASKLPVEPNMTDTVRLRPESEYEITPTAWQASFTVPKYKAAGVNTTRYEKPRPLYLRVGLGYPLQSVLDFRYTPYLGNKSAFGLEVNHSGSWSKINKLDAISTTNAFGLWGSKRLGRYVLYGDLRADYNYFDAYGTMGDKVETFNDDVGYGVEAFGKLKGRLGFGDTFTDLSRFNFRVEAATGVDLMGDFQVDIDFSVKLGQMFGPRQGFMQRKTAKHGFQFELWERGVIEAWKPYLGSSAVVFAPRYLLRLDKLYLDAGFDLRYVFNKDFGQHRTGISPALDVNYDPLGGQLVPFAKFISHLTDGSTCAALSRNPYSFDSSTPTGWTTDFRFGVAGNIASIFTYKLTGGISWLRDYTVFVANEVPYFSRRIEAYMSVMFNTAHSHGTLYTAGVELGLLPVGGFSAKVSGNWYKMSLRSKRPGDLPNFDAGLELSYSYRDIFTLSAGAKVLGERKFSNTGWDSSTSTQFIFTNRIKPVVDVTFRGEVRATNYLWVFVEGQNLANQRLYPFNHYRGLGAGVMAGVKINFDK